MRYRPLLQRLVPAGDQAPALNILLILIGLFSLFSYLHDVSKFLFESPFVDFANYYFNATLVRLGLNPFDPKAGGLGLKLSAPCVVMGVALVGMPGAPKSRRVVVRAAAAVPVGGALSPGASTLGGAGRGLGIGNLVRHVAGRG